FPHEPNGQRIAGIGDGVADFFGVEILAVFLRIRRFPTRGAVQKDIPAKGRKVGAAANPKTLREIVFVGRSVQMMCVRIDDSKIMIHEITSREDLILQPVALRDRKEDRADNDSADGDDEAESGEFADVAVVPQFPNGYGHNLRTRRIKQQRYREFLEGDEKNINPTGEQGGQDERNHDVPDHLKPARPAAQSAFIVARTINQAAKKVITIAIVAALVLTVRLLKMERVIPLSLKAVT